MAPPSLANCRQWVVAEGAVVREGGVQEIRVRRQRGTDGMESVTGAEERWFHPCAGLPDHLKLAEGPINAQADEMLVLVRTTSGDPIELRPGTSWDRTPSPLRRKRCCRVVSP